MAKPMNSIQTRYSASRWLRGAVFFLLLGLATLWYSATLEKANQQFAGPVLHATGRIDQLYVTTIRLVFHTKHAIYRYPVDGSVYTGKATPADETWAQLHVGDTIPLKYLAGHPEESRFDLPAEDKKAVQFAGFIRVIAFFLLGLACFYLVMAPFAKGPGTRSVPTATYHRNPRRRQLVGKLLMVAGVLILGVCGFQLYRSAQFSENTDQVTGITDELYTLNRSGPYDHAPPAPMVRYHYNAQGVEHTDKTAVTGATWGQLRVGGPVPIKYLPDDPSVSRIDLPDEDQRQKMDPKYALLAIFLLVVGYFLNRV